MKQALVVVDFQNDFCSPRGAGADRRGNVSRLERTATNIARALSRARASGVPVVWLRFNGDPRHHKLNLVERDRRLGKPLKCLPGTWGADFFKVAPLPGETVIDKRACFDAFLDPRFDAMLKRNKIRRLTFTGVYLDVCVDATARTAFQKGYYVSVLKDCTESLHHPKRRMLAFMEHFYGARIAASRAFPAADR